MNDYRIVKYCRLCNKRFVVERQDRKRIYCDACEQKIKVDDSDGGDLK